MAFAPRGCAVVVTATLVLVLLGVARASPCTGEFVLDTATGECVLSANGGYADEPSAWHPACPRGFACPMGIPPITCVDTPAEYAACTQGREPSAAAATATERYLAAAAANTGMGQADPTSGCNLTGTWTCGGTDCVITQPTLDAFTVRLALPNTKFLWQNATATVLSNGDVDIVYSLQTGGTTARTGRMAPSCTALAWNDSSTWTCQACENSPVLDIHIIPHTHCDTGYVRFHIAR